ncbi:hypothetical protein ABK040_011116 [Willaertia magna]
MSLHSSLVASSPADVVGLTTTSTTTTSMKVNGQLGTSSSNINNGLSSSLTSFVNNHLTNNNNSTKNVLIDNDKLLRMVATTTANPSSTAKAINSNTSCRQFITSSTTVSFIGSSSSTTTTAATTSSSLTASRTNSTNSLLSQLTIATLENLYGRIKLNVERKILILNFENLQIDNLQHVENILQCMNSIIESHLFLKKKNQELNIKIECYLNDDDIQIKNISLLEELLQKIHCNPLFSHVTRYTNKSLLQNHQKLIEESLRECEIFIKTKRVMLQRYVIIEEKLGQGTYGTVSLAIDLHNSKRVAVKRLCKKTIKIIGIEEFVKNEIQILKTLQNNPHPNIVNMYDIYENEDAYLFIMEYLQGGSLENPIVENEQFEEVLAHYYFKQMVHALCHLHEQLNVVHRDLQLSNFCLDENRKVKLIDFGISCFFTPGKKEQTLFCGNSNYASPELILKKKYAEEVDVYALGVILYKMVTGYLPFRGAQQKLMMQFTIPLEEEEGISDECKDLIEKMLEVDVEKRFTLNDVKNHSWFLQNK